MLSTYYFTQTPYSLSDVKLGSLVADKKDALDDLINQVDISSDEIVKNSDANLNFASSDPKHARLRAIIGRILAAHAIIIKSQQTRFAAKAGYSYQLRNPERVFERVCENDKVKEWLERGHYDSQDAFFVVGLRTLVDAEVVASSGNSKEAGIKGELAILPVPGLKAGGEADVQNAHFVGQRRQFDGERTFAIRYRKVGFHYFKGAEDPYLKRGPRWQSVLLDLGPENTQFVEVEVGEDDLSGIEDVDYVNLDDEESEDLM